MAGFYIVKPEICGEKKSEPVDKLLYLFFFLTRGPPLFIRVCAVLCRGQVSSLEAYENYT